MREATHIQQLANWTDDAITVSCTRLYDSGRGGKLSLSV
jgi:hypothetical protein